MLPQHDIASQGNSLTADCGNSSYTYLDICNELVNGSAPAPAAVPAPGPAPSPLAVAAPSGSASPGVLEPAPTTPSDVDGVATDRFDALHANTMHSAA